MINAKFINDNLCELFERVRRFEQTHKILTIKSTTIYGVYHGTNLSWYYKCIEKYLYLIMLSHVLFLKSFVFVIYVFLISKLRYEQDGQEAKRKLL